MFDSNELNTSVPFNMKYDHPKEKEGINSDVIKSDINYTNYELSKK